MKNALRFALCALAVVALGVTGAMVARIPHASATSAAPTAAASTSSLPRTITVNGQSTVQTKPDVAYISIGVMTENKEAKKARDANAETMKAVIKALADKGIKDEEMQTESLNIYPSYDYSNNKSTITGYQVQNMLRVKVVKIDAVGDVLDAAIAAGANQSNGVSFDVANPEALEAQALEQAFAAAKKRAEVLAKASGATLDVVFSIDEQGASYSPMYREMAMDAGKAAASAATNIQGGTVGISASISVTFTIK